MRSTGLIFAIAPALLMLGACNRPAEDAGNSGGNAAAESPTGAATPAAAPASKGDRLKIMRERHETMEKIGKATKAIGRELKATSPDLGLIRASATTISKLAPRTVSLVPPGTGPEMGKTGAKPEIWQNPKDFAAKASDFNKAAQALAAASAGNDAATIKAKFSDLGKSCKACHDKYRSEMHH